MVDKSLDILLMVIFGVSGIVMLVLAWLWDMTAADRVLTVLFGSAGVAVALLRMLRLRSSRSGADAVTVNVNTEDKF